MRTFIVLLLTLNVFYLSGQYSIDYASLAYEARLNGEWYKAAEILNHAVEVDSADAACYFELARVGYWMKGEGLSKFIQVWTKMNKRIKKNRKNIKKAIEAEPENERYYYWAGLIESHYFMTRVFTPTGWPFTRRTYKRSVKYLEKAVELEPAFMEANIYLISLYRNGWLIGGSKKKMQLKLNELEKSDVGWYAQAILSTEDPERFYIIDSLYKLYPDNKLVLSAAAVSYQWRPNKRDSVIYLWKDYLEINPKNTYALSRFAWYCGRYNYDSLAYPVLKNFKIATIEDPPLLQSAYFKAHMQLCRSKKDTNCYNEMRLKALELDEILMSTNKKPEYDWLISPRD